MFVSLLQLMSLGYGKGKDAAGQKMPSASLKRGITHGDSAPKSDRLEPPNEAARTDDRRQSMKAAAKTPKKPSKPEPAKKPAAKKPVAKKPAAKPVAKPKPVVAKTAVKKPAAKAATKVTGKPAAKPAPKTAVKTPAKTSVTKAPVKTVAPAPAPKSVSKKPDLPKKAVVPAVKPVPVVAQVAVPSKQTAPAPVPASKRAAPSSGSARKSALSAPPAPQSTPASGAKASYLPSMTPTVSPPPQVVVKKDPKLANNWKTKEATDLSDAEVLAMPDAEYMNDKQMAFFRLKLQQLKQDILASADETTEHLREDTVIVPDPADRATIEEEHALELRTRDRERKLLKKIEQSIARIDSGDYGYCDETGEPIGVGRLLARPTATLSLEAQQRRELKQRMFGD